MFNSKARAEQERAAALEVAEGETSCLFVGSKALMKSCEVHQPLPNDAAQVWPRRVLRAHQPGGRIYVHASALKDFSRHALPRMTAPFVLVTGDGDLSVCPDALGQAVVDQVLSHPHLLRWHAQNLGFQHPKVDFMPVGLDYHTISWRFRPDWGPGASPRAQEDLLHTIRAMSRPLAKRTLRGYCNWGFALKNGDRHEVIKVLPESASFFEPAPVLRTESWRRNTEFFFTISPRGVGMDCHRTWEAILLGSPPIIPDLPINRLFSTLPVVIVKDWTDLTPDFLATERERLLESEFDFAPVLLKTWKRRLFGRDDLPELRMRYQEFIAMGPADFRDAVG